LAVGYGGDEAPQHGDIVLQRALPVENGGVTVGDGVGEGREPSEVVGEKLLLLLADRAPLGQAVEDEAHLLGEVVEEDLAGGKDGDRRLRDRRRNIVSWLRRSFRLRRIFGIFGHRHLGV
jgi:hypothetical protein